MTKRRLFMAYCAFAPFFQTALVAIFCRLFQAEFMEMLRTVLWLAMPFSAWFLVETLMSAFHAGQTHNQQRLGTFATTLSMYSHASVYCYVMTFGLIDETIGPVRLHSDEKLVMGLVASLACSAIALLVSWDGVRRIEASGARTSQ